MPREWRFGAPSAAWPDKCAGPETSPLLADVTAAFVDRSPIDWGALLSRVAASPERPLFENLRRLDRIRAPSLQPVAGPSPRAALVVKAVLVLAALQTACSLAVVGAAFASHEPAVYLTSRVVLALAFASAGVLLGTASSDPRALYLLTAFASAASAFAGTALTDLPDGWSAPFEVLIRGLFPEAFVPAMMWQLAMTFPQVRRFGAFDVLARRAAAAAWLLGILRFGINLALA